MQTLGAQPLHSQIKHRAYLFSVETGSLKGDFADNWIVTLRGV